MLTAIFGAAVKAEPKAIPNFGPQRLGLEYLQRDAVKFYMKALEDEVYRRNMIGHTVPGTKLVQKMAHRVWKEEAAKKAQNQFGPAAITKPELKSPAELELLSPAAKTFVHEWAYTPNTGL